MCFMEKRTSVFDYTGRLIQGSTAKALDLELDIKIIQVVLVLYCQGAF